MLAEDLLQPLQRGKDRIHRFVVSLLAGGKAGFIHAVVDVVIDPAVQLINLFPQRWRVVIPGPGAKAIEGGIKHADDFCRLIADDGLLFFIPQHRHGHASGVVRVGVQIQLIKKVMLVEGIAGGFREAIVKGPAVFQHQRIDHGYGEKRLQTF
ncbi:Uncharacterised protein [Klebsiella pneumoniae]|nr:Uncharacterised protein [Klebsiella pneumoniae]